MLGPFREGHFFAPVNDDRSEQKRRDHYEGQSIEAQVTDDRQRDDRAGAIRVPPTEKIDMPVAARGPV
jgi:hypothetical protein